MSRCRSLIAVVALCLVATAPGSKATPRSETRPSPRLDAQVQHAVQQRTPGTHRVILRVRPGAEWAVRQALEAHRARVYAEHDSLNAIAAEMDGEDLLAFAVSEHIESISSDARVEGHLLGLVGGLLNVATGLLDPGEIDTSQPPLSPKTLRATLGLSSTSWTGRGVGVAVIDSGIAAMSDFDTRITAFYDFTRGGLVAVTPFDDFGHGTHIAGAIGGSGKLSRDAAHRGLAPKARLIGLKVLDANGQGWTSDVIRAVDFAIANKSALGIDIINLSLGHPIYEPAGSDPLVQAVERATRAGIVVVAAAGNFGKHLATGAPGYAGITSPGNAPSAITVGAVNTWNTTTRDDDRLASYSSRGPTWYDGIVKPDVVAPGHDLIAPASRNSTIYRNYPKLRVKAYDYDYMRLSGTSMATAVTSGVVALMLEANRYTNAYPQNPSLSPNAVKAMLHYTALGIRDEKGVEYDLLTKGAGSLNGRASVDLARAVNTSQPESTPWLISSLAPTSPYTYIDGKKLAWSQMVVWGAAVVWGNTVDFNQPAWSQMVVWGAADVWGNAVVWGNNVVWDNPSLWANMVVWGANSIGAANDDMVVWGATSGLTSQSVVWGNLATYGNSQAASACLKLPE